MWETDKDTAPSRPPEPGSRERSKQELGGWIRDVEEGARAPARSSGENLGRLCPLLGLSFLLCRRGAEISVSGPCELSQAGTLHSIPAQRGGAGAPVQVSKPQPIWLVACFCKNVSLAHTLSVRLHIVCGCMEEESSCHPVWPSTPTIFSLWPFTGKVCTDGWISGLSHGPVGDG